MNNRHLVVREHQTIRLRPQGELTRAAHAAFLARIPMLPKGVLTPTHDGLRTASHCGLIQAGPWTLEILPKIYDGEQDAPDRGALVRMLAACFDVPVWLDGSARSGLAEDLLTTVIRGFLDEAQRQRRQGWIKSYVDYQAQLTRPRGRLDLAQQVRRGRATAHRLHCTFDELTANNGFNQVVRAALVVAQARLPVGSRLGVHAEQLDLALADVDELAADQALKLRLPHQRLTRRYDRLLLLSSWLLRLLSPDVHYSPEQGLGLTFDMNRLFQEAVSIALQAAIRRHRLRDRLRLSQERPVRPLVKDATGNGRFMMMPDLCLWLDEKLIAILDTKWKRLSPRQDRHKAGIAQADVYQLLAYGYTYGCNQLTLIYPHHPELEDWTLPRFRYCAPSAEGIVLQVATVDVDALGNGADRILAQHIGKL